MAKPSQLGAGISPPQKLELVYQPRPNCRRDFYVSVAELNLINPAEDEHAALGVLRDVSALLTARNTLHHVCDGTLLGILRENGFISGDNDIDFRVDRDALTEDLEQALHAAGFTLFKRSFVEGQRSSIGIVRDGIAVDLYGTDFSATSAMFHFVFRRGYLSHRLPFRGVEQMDFRGTLIWVPKDATQELVACYGADWHQPRNSWDNLFDYQPVFRCTGGLRDLFAAALKFQKAHSQKMLENGRGASLRGLLRAVFWLRWA